MGSKTLVPALLAFLIGGCPKRQTTPRIVYVQTPPPPTEANKAAQDAPGTLIIQEPGLPAVAESPTPATTAPPAQQEAQPEKKAPKPARQAPHPAEEKAPPENPQPDASAESRVQLQTPGGDVQEAVLGKHLDQMALDLNNLARRTDLSDNQQRTVKDASTFRSQASDALSQHDLLRAQQLADKADLLIKAVLGRP